MWCLGFVLAMKRSAKFDLSERRKELKARLDSVDACVPFWSLYNVDGNFPGHLDAFHVLDMSEPITYAGLDRSFYTFASLLIRILNCGVADLGRWKAFMGDSRQQLVRCDIAMGVPQQRSSDLWNLYLGSVWTYGKKQLFVRGSNEVTYEKRLIAFEKFGLKYCDRHVYAGGPVTYASLYVDEKFTALQRQDLTQDMRRKLDALLAEERSNIVFDEDELDIMPLSEYIDSISVPSLEMLIPRRYQ